MYFLQQKINTKIPVLSPNGLILDQTSVAEDIDPLGNPRMKNIKNTINNSHLIHSEILKINIVSTLIYQNIAL